MDEAEDTIDPYALSEPADLPLGLATEPQYVGPVNAPDRYALGERRSSGAEGELWRGNIMVDGIPLPVAVKINFKTPENRFLMATERITQQAEILRSLEHPNIVKVREAFVGPERHARGKSDSNADALYTVMNYVDGENLLEWVRRRPIRDVTKMTDIISQLAAGVAYLHSGVDTSGKPVFHRDIKPANVIITKNGTVRLTDFGLAQLADGTSAPVGLGTPAFMAQESFLGESTTASDRYGLGAVAYFLFTGVAPNPHDLAGTRARLLTVFPDQANIADHIMLMLSPEPEDRPTDLVEWAETLAGAVANSTDPAAATGIVSSAIVPSERVSTKPTGATVTSSAEETSPGEFSTVTDRDTNTAPAAAIPMVQSADIQPTLEQAAPTYPAPKSIKLRNAILVGAAALITAITGLAFAFSGGHLGHESSPPAEGDVALVREQSGSNITTQEAMLRTDHDCHAARVPVDFGASEIGRLRPATPVEITGDPIDGWYPVTFEGHSGWVSGHLLVGPDIASDPGILCP